MLEDIAQHLMKLVKLHEGLLAIVISDRDGAPIVKAADEDAPELALNPSFLTTFGTVADQASKIGIGQNKSIVCIYSNYQVIHFNKLPLVVTLFGTSDANTGLFLSLEKHLDPLVEQFIPVVESS